MTKRVSTIRGRLARQGEGRAYLEEKTLVRVRFNEVDALHIVWHGHYANYFEEARRAFGRRFDLDYPTFMTHATALPVISFHVEYFAPARLPDSLEVTARLLKPESVRLDFDYEIRRENDATLLAAGSTSQVLTTPEGALMVSWPEFMRSRLEAWESQWRQP